MPLAGRGGSNPPSDTVSPAEVQEAPETTRPPRARSLSPGSRRCRGRGARSLATARTLVPVPSAGAIWPVQHRPADEDGDRSTGRQEQSGCRTQFDVGYGRDHPAKSQQDHSDGKHDSARHPRVLHPFSLRGRPHHRVASELAMLPDMLRRDRELWGMSVGEAGTRLGITRQDHVGIEDVPGYCDDPEDPSEYWIAGKNPPRNSPIPPRGRRYRPGRRPRPPAISAGRITSTGLDVACRHDRILVEGLVHLAGRGGSNPPPTPMERMQAFLEGLRIRAATRRRRALHRAAAEMERRDPHGGSIWRSGKGGAHHDR